MSYSTSGSLSGRSEECTLENRGVKFLIGSSKNPEIISLDSSSKGRLCAVSEFINCACKQQWASGRSGTIDLTVDPDTTATLFSLFMSWALGGDITRSASYINTPATMHRLRRVHAKLRQLIDAWLLGDRLLCDGFMNAAMDVLIRTLQTQYVRGRLVHIPCSILRCVYRHTNDGRSPLRRVFLDFVTAAAVSTKGGMWMDDEDEDDGDDDGNEVEDGEGEVLCPHRCRRCAPPRRAALSLEWMHDLWKVAQRTLTKCVSCYHSPNAREELWLLQMPWTKRVCEYRTYRRAGAGRYRNGTYLERKRGCRCQEDDHIKCCDVFECWWLSEPTPTTRDVIPRAP